MGDDEESASKKLKLETPPEVNCLICDDPCPTETVLRCSLDHIFCDNCFDQFVRTKIEEALENPIEFQSKGSCVFCPVDYHTPGFPAQILAKHCSGEVFEMFMHAKEEVQKIEAFAAATAAFLEEKKKAAKEKVGDDVPPEILAKQLKQLMPNARMCGNPKCKFGPVDHFACSNLQSHHGEKVLTSSKGVTKINNACPKCNWFSPQINDWPQWDGILREGGTINEPSPVSPIVPLDTLWPGQGSGILLYDPEDETLILGRDWTKTFADIGGEKASQKELGAPPTAFVSASYVCERKTLGVIDEETLCPERVIHQVELPKYLYRCFLVEVHSGGEDECEEFTHQVESSAPKGGKFKAGIGGGAATGETYYYLICTLGTSNKFYEITLNGATSNLRWGRVGSTGVTSLKLHSSPSEAQSYAAKMAQQKRNKGYVDAPGPGASGTGGGGGGTGGGGGGTLKKQSSQSFLAKLELDSMVRFPLHRMVQCAENNDFVCRDSTDCPRNLRERTLDIVRAFMEGGVFQKNGGWVGAYVPSASVGSPPPPKTSKKASTHTPTTLPTGVGCLVRRCRAPDCLQIHSSHICNSCGEEDADHRTANCPNKGKKGKKK